MKEDGIRNDARPGGAIRSWTRRDSLLYAVGVGETCFGFEEDEAKFALPSFASLLGAELSGLRSIEGWDKTRMVLRGQSVELLEELPIEGSVHLVNRAAVVASLGRGTIATIETAGYSVDDRRCLFRTSMSFYLAGGPRASIPFRSDRRASPAGPPDEVIVFDILPQQSLIYRLSGDRHPVHVDPAVAASLGFHSPTLPGLCTFGFAGRAALRFLQEDGPLRSLTLRFSKPAFPGGSLCFELWRTQGGCLIVVRDERGQIVADQGFAGFAG